MQAVIIAVITTFIGVTVAVLAARHYYTRSAKHRLAVYVLPAPPIFENVDPDTRRDLSIQFRGVAVGELSVMEFLVANEGAHPIREPLAPLTFLVDETIRIVDASITYVQPDGREVAAEVKSSTEFVCKFDLLNPDEYFYVKLIADGRLRRSAIKCRITAENLPPNLVLESPINLKIGLESSDRDWSMLIPASILYLIAAAIFLPVVGLYNSHPGYFPFSGTKFTFIWWLTPAVALAALVTLLVLILAAVLTVGACVGDVPRSKRFKGPRRPYHAHIYGYGYGYGYPFPPGAESESALTRYPRDDAQ